MLTIRTTGLMTVGVRNARQLGELEEEEQLSQSSGSATDTTVARVFRS